MVTAARKGTNLWRLACVACLGVALLAVGGSGVAATSDGPADSLLPSPVSLNLGRGSATTLHPTLHLAPAPATADILLVLDTTASMGTAINNAKGDANAIVSEIKANIPGARFAVADFKDYPSVVDAAGNGVTGYGGFPFGEATDYPWKVDQDFTDNIGTVTCGDAGALTPIECAVSKLTATGGFDEPEAYNRAFFEAYHDTGATGHLSYTTGAPRFMVVLGDSLPHDAGLSSAFPSCPNTGPTDPGPDHIAGNSDDLATLATLQALKAANTNVSFVTYNEPHSIGGKNVAACQEELAKYTGGNEVVHGPDTAGLGTQIIDLINQAAAHIDSVTFNTTAVSAPAGVTNFNPSTWLPPTGFNPPLPYGPISAPADVTFDETITVPQNAVVGEYKFDVHALADGNERAVQHITVNVTNSAVSALTMSADEPSVPAGITSVPYGSIPSSRLASLTPDVGSAAAGSIAAGSIAAGSIAAGSIASGSIAAGSIAAGSIAAGSIAAGSIAAGSIGFGPIAAGSIAAGSIPSGGVALKSVLLSQLPLVGTTWADILKDSPYANQPLQAVTLYDIANYSTAGSDGKTPWQRLMALSLRQVPFFTSLWRNIPFGVLLLGNAPLDTLPIPKAANGSSYASWRDAITGNGGSLTGVDTSTNTALGVAIAGQFGTTNVGSIAAGSIASGSIASGSIAAGSIAAGSIAAGSIDLSVTSLAGVPLTQVSPLSAIVNCAPAGTFNCSGKTLGQASSAELATHNVFQPNVTLADILNDLSPARTITIDEIAQAVLAVSEYPWEQVNVQGLQDVAGTGKNVHYHVDFDLVCSQATTISSVHVKLPTGFFPVAGSSKFSYAGGTPLAAADPSNGSNGPVWSSIPGSPCGGGTATRHVRLDFMSYAGLTLGTKTSDVDVTANGTYSASQQAPVLVTQNWEPSDDPGTAPAIAKDTLLVGHVATGNDVDFYRFPLDGLAPGTTVTAYLKVPRDGTDLDLVINKPAAPGVQSSAAGSIAAGSIAAGSIPIEDSGPGVDNSRGALQPDSAADLAAGSIASGSIAAGSIAAGSISANRGGVNEAAKIVTRGETGSAVIGVSGYNSAFSDQNYVLRIKVTPPPTLPACDPMTGLGSATPGVLPTVPTSNNPNIKALFLVDRQRMVGLYGPTATDAMLGPGSPLSGVAAAVGGQVLQVDGAQSVRTAYSAWDSNPCSIDASNNVVRSINDLVSTYRPKYPNLKYVVLLGTHQAEPMWAQQDLTSTSPEIDEANDLAFSTHGLTKGNAIYAAAAQNAVLTDGAYGAFSKRTWLGHDLPLPDVSVSRLVETPDDINGQLQQYLDSSGVLSLHSALTTGDSFFADGAEAASEALGAQLGLAPADQQTLLPPTLWTRQNLLDDFFQKSPIPDVGALWAHYSHWVAQPAGLPATPTLSDLATTADVTNPLNGHLLFTVGCHSGLNVPDTIMPGETPANFGPNEKRFLDWAEAYMRAKTAVYVANTGFGYGDTTTIDLSERLMNHFANNINSGGTIGEQWVRALHQYYSEPSNYDVIDEKVMVEANMYGLPFYGFSGTAQNPPTPPTPPTHGVENGVDTAHLPEIAANIQQHILGDGRSLFEDPNHPDGSTFTDSNGVPLTMGTLSVFYRPAQPEVSRDVTVPGTVAHGVWIRSLTTHTVPNVTPVKPFPIVRSAEDAPARDYPNIFFPAAISSVNRDVMFGAEHDTAVVNLGKFFPGTGGQGTEQVVDRVGLDIGYSNSNDSTAPQIFQAGAVQTSPGHFTAFVRTGDASGLNRVAVMYNDGTSPVWNVALLNHVSGDLWTNSSITASGPIAIDAQAQDNAGNVGYSFNKAVNFQSTVDTSNPSTSATSPLPNDVYTLNQQVRASFDCSDSGAVASCTGSSDGGPAIVSGGFLNTSTAGQHTFTITARDLSGNPTTTMIPYVVRFAFSGFRPPVDAPPILNVVKGGNTVPVKWGLADRAGVPYVNLNAVQSISSTTIKCPNATTDPDPLIVPVGLSGLKVIGTDLQFNWATDKGWAGTCRRLFVHFSDLTTPYADFQFK